MVPRGLDFCALDQHVGDPGAHWDTKGDTLGSRVGFPWVFENFGIHFGVVFDTSACFFVGLR